MLERVDSLAHVLPITKYTTIFYHRSCHALMFYVFLNIRRTKFCITRLSASSRSCQRSKRSCRLSTRSCSLSTCSCRLSTPSCRLSTPSCTMSCRLPVLSDLLLWSGAFSTHCTDASRRLALYNMPCIMCSNTTSAFWFCLNSIILLPYISWIAPARQQCCPPSLWHRVCQEREGDGGAGEGHEVHLI